MSPKNSLQVVVAITTFLLVFFLFPQDLMDKMRLSFTSMYDYQLYNKKKYERGEFYKYIKSQNIHNINIEIINKNLFNDFLITRKDKSLAFKANMMLNNTRINGVSGKFLDSWYPDHFFKMLLI